MTEEPSKESENPSLQESNAARIARLLHRTQADNIIPPPPLSSSVMAEPGLALPPMTPVVNSAERITAPSTDADRSADEVLAEIKAQIDAAVASKDRAALTTIFTNDSLPPQVLWQKDILASEAYVDLEARPEDLPVITSLRERMTELFSSWEGSYQNYEDLDALDDEVRSKNLPESLTRQILSEVNFKRPPRKEADTNPEDQDIDSAPTTLGPLPQEQSDMQTLDSIKARVDAAVAAKDEVAIRQLFADDNIPPELKNERDVLLCEGFTDLLPESADLVTSLRASMQLALEYPFSDAEKKTNFLTLIPPNLNQELRNRLLQEFEAKLNASRVSHEPDPPMSVPLQPPAIPEPPPRIDSTPAVPPTVEPLQIPLEPEPEKSLISEDEAKKIALHKAYVLADQEARAAMRKEIHAEVAAEYTREAQDKDLIKLIAVTVNRAKDAGDQVQLALAKKLLERTNLNATDTALAQLLIAQAETDLVAHFNEKGRVAEVRGEVLKVLDRIGFGANPSNNKVIEDILDRHQLLAKTREAILQEIGDQSKFAQLQDVSKRDLAQETTITPVKPAEPQASEEPLPLEKTIRLEALKTVDREMVAIPVLTLAASILEAHRVNPKQVVNVEQLRKFLKTVGYKPDQVDQSGETALVEAANREVKTYLKQIRPDHPLYDLIYEAGEDPFSAHPELEAVPQTEIVVPSDIERAYLNSIATAQDSETLDKLEEIIASEQDKGVFAHPKMADLAKDVINYRSAELDSRSSTEDAAVSVDAEVTPKVQELRDLIDQAIKEGDEGKLDQIRELINQAQSVEQTLNNIEAQGLAYLLDKASTDINTFPAQRKFVQIIRDDLTRAIAEPQAVYNAAAAIFVENHSSHEHIDSRTLLKLSHELISLVYLEKNKLRDEYYENESAVYDMTATQIVQLEERLPWYTTEQQERLGKMMDERLAELDQANGI